LSEILKIRIYKTIILPVILYGVGRRRWMDNIKMDLLEIGWGHVDWIDLAEDRDKWRDLVNAVMNLRVA
jgi:hypothetical protein